MFMLIMTEDGPVDSLRMGLATRNTKRLQGWNFLPEQQVLGRGKGCILNFIKTPENEEI